MGCQKNTSIKLKYRDCWQSSHSVNWNEKERHMEVFEIIKLVIGSGGVLGVGILIFKAGSFAKEMKSMSQKIDKIDVDVCEMKTDIRRLDVRISHIEGYLMGRDVRNGTENR